MKSHVEQASLKSYDRKTVMQQAATNTVERQAPCAKPEFVAGSGPHLTKETQPLLRLRLRAAALILLIGFAAFLVRHAIGIVTGEPLNRFLFGVHTLVV